MNTVFTAHELYKLDPLADIKAHLERPLSVEIYQAAVENLMAIAKQDTSGSRAAAQVLLSAYNGSEFQLDISDLCLLDFPLYACAIAVIRGRVELRIEPHEIISDGGQRFNALWDQWCPSFHIANRSKREE